MGCDFVPKQNLMKETKSPASGGMAKIEPGSTVGTTSYGTKAPVTI